MKKERRNEIAHGALPVKSVCAEIQASNTLRRPLRPHMPVIIRAVSIDVTGEIVLLGVKQLECGERCYAQLFPDAPVDLRCGMPFVLLNKSGDEIVAEGSVLLIGLRKVKPVEVESAIGILERLAGGDCVGALHGLIRFYSPNGISRSFLLEALSLEQAEFDNLLRQLTGIVEIKLKRDALYMDETDVEHWKSLIIRLIKEYHIAHPHEIGPDAAFIEEHFKPSPARAALGDIVNRLKADKTVIEEKGSLRMPEFSPSVEEPLDGVKGDAYRLYREMEFSPEGLRYVAKELRQPLKRLLGILLYLCEKGYLLRLDRDTFVTMETFNKARDIVMEMIKKDGDVEVGKFRDKIKSSRRITMLLLERFDKKGWTERSNNKRTLGPKPERHG